MNDRCLVCGSRGSALFPLEEAHWPVAVGNRSRKKHPELPTVPICHECHMGQHAGDEWVIERLIHKAPVYWRETGKWNEAKPYYERYLSRRRYFERTTERTDAR